MPTMQEFAEQYLASLRMWPQDAKAVIEEQKKEPGMDSIHWGGDTTSYSAQLLAAIQISLKAAGLAWIDANYPLAWYRPMFVDAPADSSNVTRT